MIIQGRPSAGAWLIGSARLTVVVAVVTATRVREQLLAGVLRLPTQEKAPPWPTCGRPEQLHPKRRSSVGRIGGPMPQAPPPEGRL